MSGQALLLGAGHAHLYAVEHAVEYRRSGHRLTVADNPAFWYSGLATGMLGGAYAPEKDQIDVAALARAGTAQFLDAQARCIDPASRTVLLDNGAEVHYDVLSLNLGSVVYPLPGESGNEAVYAVKPIRRLWALRSFLEGLFDEEGTRAARVVIAGGGATGCEIAANVAGLAERHGAQVTITVVNEGSRLLEHLPESASRSVAESLRTRGVATRCNARVQRIDGRGCTLSDGARLDFDALVNATGLKPSPLMRNSGLTVDGAGALLVNSHLQSLGDPRIFGGGDCIAIEGRPLPKIGVYAVRAAPVLHRNLLAALDGKPTEAFRAQRHFLSIMNLGDGTGLATRNGLWWRGRAAFWLKDWIDRRFIERFR